MIRLTTEKRINKKGEEVDSSLYLVRLDANNLAIMRDGRYEGYYGCVQTAMKRALNISIKGSHEALTLEMILERIGELEEVANTLKTATIDKILEEEKINRK